jgi:diguanylate cyclase (GGDEF)-like protein
MAVGHRPGGLAWLGLVELGAAGVSLLVPWRRLPSWATLLLALPAFAVLGWSEVLGLVPAQATGVPFVIVFAWVGANHRRWTSLALLPSAALAYVLAVRAGAGFDIRALLLTLAVCAIVGEIIAHAMDTAVQSHARAQQAARAFGAVARASAGLHHLDSGRVLDAVADAVIDLGYDGATLALIDTAQDSVRPMHVRGVAAQFGDRTFRGSDGATGEAWRTGQPVVVEDYQSSPLGIEQVRASGVRCAVAVPVLIDGGVVAVLHATSLRRRAVPEDEIEALRILAAAAGTALDNAQEFLAERTSAQQHATAAMTDPLTAVGNRRYADQMLDALRPGDSLVMIDLDHFKDVNDRFGHAAGDELLRGLATHLVRSLRVDDRVARMGGEEFLIALKGGGPARAEGTVQRLLEGWRAGQPATTFSAGVAHHGEGNAATTLERADQALYAAKAASRDTWRAYAPARLVPAQATHPSVGGTVSKPVVAG